MCKTIGTGASMCRVIRKDIVIDDMTAEMTEGMMIVEIVGMIAATGTAIVAKVWRNNCQGSYF